MNHRLALLLLSTAAIPQVALAQSSASDFTTGYRYDGMRRLTGEIKPDPDAGGAIKYAAIRNTYDSMGRVIKVEKGELASWQSELVAPSAWSGFTIFQTVETEYDSAGRKIKDVLKGGGATHRVTQYKYDALNRLECTAVRMNTAIFTSLPADACALGTAGSQGPDRITKNIYDVAGQLIQVRQAVGTSSPALEQAYVTLSYTDNGKPQYVVDANGNKAEYVYDGFDRQSRWKFPSSTLPSSFNPATPATALSTAGAVSSTDYEEYGYDANSNRTSLRKREGLSLGFAYDELNRMTVKTVPERSSPVALDPTHTRDVYYAYDLRGFQTKARFDSLSGEGITSEYDGFGRLKQTGINMGGYSRVLKYENDPNNNRWRVEHPDGQYFDYAFDGLDRMYYGNQNSGLGLFQTAFNAAGLRVTMHRTNNNHSVYGYDGGLRMNAFANAFIGGTGTVEYAYTHNPAGQIVTRARNNDSYAYLGNVNVSRGYTKNGLNQYTVAGGATFTHDANGNLTSDGASTYAYDLENRLVSASGAASASLLYDPLGRLFQTSGGSTGTTQFLYDGDALVAEYSSTNVVLRRYVHGAGVDEPLVWYEGSSLSTPKYLHADHQGTVTGIANADGTLSSINSYDEYGIPATANVGRFQYTGQAWIPELGIYYYKARMYSPTLGRFLQTDPVGYEDQMNLYAYVGNDPVNKYDPSGTKSCKTDAECKEESSEPDGPDIIITAQIEKLATNIQDIQIGRVNSIGGDVVPESPTCRRISSRSNNTKKNLPGYISNSRFYNDPAALNSERITHSMNQTEFGVASLAAAGVGFGGARAFLAKLITRGTSGAIGAGAFVVGLAAKYGHSRSRNIVEAIDARLDQLESIADGTCAVR